MGSSETHPVAYTPAFRLGSSQVSFITLAEREEKEEENRGERKSWEVQEKSQEEMEKKEKVKG